MSKCDNKICSVAKICNPTSGRCVKRTSQIGKKILQCHNPKRKLQQSKMTQPKYQKFFTRR